MTKQAPYILVADDDPDDQEMLVNRMQIRHPAIPVRCLDGGVETLTYLHNCPTDELPLVMILDYKMPGLTGAEVLQSIRPDGRYGAIPKIIWSTSNNAEYKERSIQSGADKYFTKPSDMSAFDHLVDYLSQLFSSRIDQAGG